MGSEVPVILRRLSVLVLVECFLPRLALRLMPVRAVGRGVPGRTSPCVRGGSQLLYLNVTVDESSERSAHLNRRKISEGVSVGD